MHFFNKTFSITFITSLAGTRSGPAGAPDHEWVVAALVLRRRGEAVPAPCAGAERATAGAASRKRPGRYCGQP